MTTAINNSPKAQLETLMQREPATLEESLEFLEQIRALRETAHLAGVAFSRAQATMANKMYRLLSERVTEIKGKLDDIAQSGSNERNGEILEMMEKIQPEFKTRVLSEFYRRLDRQNEEGDTWAFAHLHEKTEILKDCLVNHPQS